jgi:hypothetical protein
LTTRGAAVGGAVIAARIALLRGGDAATVVEDTVAADKKIGHFDLRAVALRRRVWEGPCDACAGGCGSGVSLPACARAQISVTVR